MTVQASLFDPSLFDQAPGTAPRPLLDEPYAVGPLTGTVRHQLARGAWVDLLPSWTTGGGLLERLLEDVPWRAERRPMYDRVVDVPRLLCHYAEGDALPHPVLEAVRDALNARYEPELGEPLVSAGLCLYRDGADSVAWHGDTIGRGRTSDTVVAILSLARRASSSSDLAAAVRSPAPSPAPTCPSRGRRRTWPSRRRATPSRSTQSEPERYPAQGRSATRSTMATSSSWVAPASARGSTPSRRPHVPSDPG
ncbi:MAG: hypothetical protein ACRYG2_27335 [Janthinobacterium lividum]